MIWPETAVSFLLNYGDEALPILSEAAGAPVLMGIQRALSEIEDVEDNDEVRPEAAKI